MARKKKGKKRVYVDKFLAEIGQLFIRPMLTHKHPEEENKQFLIRMFHLDTRIIDLYRAHKRFKMPGLFYLDQGSKVQGLGYRNVAAGTKMLVRHDLVMETIDVQFLGGAGNRDQVFYLTRSEWYSIAPCLRMESRKSQSAAGIWDHDPSR